MDVLVQSLVDTVTAADGAIEWSALIDSVDYKDRQQVPKALRVAKAQKKLKRHLQVIDGVKIHRVLVWSHPDNPLASEE